MQSNKPIERKGCKSIMALEFKSDAFLYLSTVFKAGYRIPLAPTLLIKLCEAAVKISCETVQTTLMWSYVTPSFHPHVFNVLCRDSVD